VIGIGLLGLFGGLALSGLFSGSETGFYRLSRMRLMLDAAQEDRTAKVLLWFSNHPSLFVATVLTGNNLANYLISLSTVTLVYEIWGTANEWLATAASVLITPLVFVYGELLPKTVFLQRPETLLRPIWPILMALGVLLVPITFPLWLLGRILAGLGSEPERRLQAILARRELMWILSEAKAAGVLRPLQHRVAEKVFELAHIPVSKVTEAVEKVPHARLPCSLSELLEKARQSRTPELLLLSAQGEPVGYVRVSDLLIQGMEACSRPKPLPSIPRNHSVVEALVRLFHSDDPLAKVADEQGHSLGFVRRRRLYELVLGGPPPQFEIPFRR
jgi:CBS domain containing-hemolysin-like protein